MALLAGGVGWGWGAFVLCHLRTLVLLHLRRGPGASEEITDILLFISGRWETIKMLVFAFKGGGTFSPPLALLMLTLLHLSKSMQQLI